MLPLSPHDARFASSECRVWRHSRLFDVAQAVCERIARAARRENEAAERVMNRIFML